MSLIKSINTLQIYLPTTSTSVLPNILPFVKQAERDFIIPAIGKAQYDAIDSEYNEEGSGSMSAEQYALLEKLQAALSLYSYYLWIPTGQLQIGDNGIRIANTDTLKTAFQWQIDELRLSLLKQAGSAMDDLFVFLQDNIDDYDLWADSDAYKQFADFFIQTAKRYTEIYSPLGNSHYSFIQLKSTMRKIEDFIIQSEIGTAFFTELKTQLKANGLSDANKLVIPYIQNAVAHLTISRAIPGTQVSFDSRGIVSFHSIGGADGAADNILQNLIKQTNEDGVAYIQLLRKFLKDNIDDYPTYANSDVYDADTDETDTGFTNSDDNTFAGLL